ncbi:uncharacterized protein LOC129761768 [Toxorhynchites rutilus septentrionalis]|uniref:uncharacterized protein LOC129761768 n=1 Tax=Toxorhynchites rutilus septentrionalis TaxID=329112 RepID=UPI0024799CE0|nr:uncharacterized protein LOC129761768 [Toxorhynchites rutilus septentrionalis]
MLPLSSLRWRPQTPTGARNAERVWFLRFSTVNERPAPVLNQGRKRTASQESRIDTTPKMGPRQQTITSAFDRPFSYGAGGTKGKEITTCVMYMVCTDNMPLCTVDKKGFRQLMKTVCPLYKVPHETQFREILKNKFIKSKEIVRNRLRSITSICLTTDVWTEMLNVRSYLGITGHFIHDSQLHSVLLGVVECKQSKTSEYIANLLRVCCNDWGIKNETISCVTTDLGANILGAVRMEYGERRHVPCFAHTINLIASKAVPLYKEAYAARMEPVIEEDNDDELDGVEDHCTIEVSITPEKNMIYIIKKMKTIIKFFKASETATRELRKLQLADNKKEGQCLGLVLDVRTRWNSIMAMIERFLVMAHYISRVLLVVPKTPTMLTADELSILKEICKVLHPLETVTTEMSAEKYVTISKIIPLVRLLKIVSVFCIISIRVFNMFCRFIISFFRVSIPFLSLYYVIRDFCYPRLRCQTIPRTIGVLLYYVFLFNFQREFNEYIVRNLFNSIYGYFSELQYTCPNNLLVYGLHA